MSQMCCRFALLLILCTGVASLVSSLASAKPVLADIAMLEAVGVELLKQDVEIGLGYAILSEEQELRLSKLAHSKGKCAGFQALPFGPLDAKNPLINQVFGQIKQQNERNRRWNLSTFAFSEVQHRASVANALGEVSPERIQQTVKFLSAFPNRYYRSEKPNKHIDAVRERIQGLIDGSSLPAKVETVSHKGLKQHSIRVRVSGSTRPEEIIVLGGHLDSINHEDGDGAPGADDNASGSANIIEALRVVLMQPQPERTIDFFLYAGEEGGLLGSSEIAETYKKAEKDVVAVLQLDMTMYPGSGPMTLGSLTDFTSGWLRGYLETVNALYLKVKLVKDECGYACSDHASWYRQGYPTLAPFESGVNDMNRNLHTTRDVIDDKSNFEHAAVFAKIALILALDLGNSSLRAPTFTLDAAR